jgi:hypothetical protein
MNRAGTSIHDYHCKEPRVEALLVGLGSLN